MTLEIYRPLDAERDEIRLLALRPGEGDTPIEVELTYASLADNPQYEALSYVWGDPHVTARARLITHSAQLFGWIKEQIIDIHLTLNLESALRHLRMKYRKRLLWADALCINQDDPSEKPHQIRLMHDIYRKARRVCMWIGDAADNSDVAMDLINRYSSSFGEEKEKELRYNRILSENWRALTYLVCRPWFTRRWIVQEISLASDSIIYCGTKSTSWRALCNATMSLEGLIHQYRVHPKQSISQFRNAHPFGDWDISNESIKAWTEGMAHIFDIEWALKTIITQPKLPTLRQLVRIFRYKAVTDPRDAVFALFSLSKESKQAQFDIPWMAAATVMDVFLESTKLSVKMENSLDIICQSFGPGPCGHSPSWVPRFYNIEERPGCCCKKSNDLTMQYQPEQAISSYMATGDAKPKVRYEGSKLIARGFRLDRVHAVLERCKPGPKIRQIPRSWKDKVLSLDAIHVDKDPKPGNCLGNNKSSKFDAFWRTLVTNRVPPVRNRTDAPPACGTFFKNWCKGEMLVTRPSVVFDRNIGQSREVSINRGIWNSILGRRFIISETNRIGLAYKRVQKDDLICILLGCSVPVILRPSVEPEHSGCYYFIGDSYIHGVMNGEAMKKLQEGKYEEQDFAIV